MKKILVATAALALLGATAVSAQDQGGGRWRGGGGQGQGQGRQSQNWQGGGQRQGGGGGGGSSQSAQSSSPDWNSYYRNNPDLQRDYQNNRRNPAYTESQDAYAARQYREHGQSEGRALPSQTVQRQPDQQSQPQQQQQASRQGQWNGGGQNNNWQGGNRSNDGNRGGSWNGSNQNRSGWDGNNRGGNDNGRWNDNNRGRWDGNNNGSRSNNNWRQYNRNWQASQRYRWGSYRQPRGYYYRRWNYGDFLPSLFWASQSYWINDYSYFGLPYPPPGCMWVRYGDDALLIDRYSGEIVQVVYGLFY